MIVKQFLLHAYAFDDGAAESAEVAGVEGEVEGEGEDLHGWSFRLNSYDSGG